MKWIIPAVLGVCAIISVSVLLSTLVIRSQGFVRFISEPRPDNPDYGYLEINGKEYRQLYTTTEVIDNNVPAGSHYHRIDLRTAR